MALRQTNRFVSQVAPDQGNADNSDQKYLEKRYAQEEAVFLFKKERTESVLLATACNTAESLLRTGKVGSKSFFPPDHDSKVAIVVYTLESPNVYMDFNSRSRQLSISSWDNFPYKGMWLLLNKAVLWHARLCKNSPFGELEKHVYRGISTLVNVAQGSDFYFQQITSSSLSADVASSFSSNGGTMFSINYLTPFTIGDLSVYPAEAEVLISGLERFTVIDVEDTNSGRKIYLSLAGTMLEGAVRQALYANGSIS